MRGEIKRMSDQIHLHQQMYRIQPEKGWRFVEFSSDSVEVNGTEYFFRSFINSGEFIIHDVVAMKQTYGMLYHVWYENK